MTDFALLASIIAFGFSCFAAGLVVGSDVFRRDC